MPHSLRLFAQDIKISHSVFALPFVLVGLMIGPLTQRPSLSQALAILACMVTARSFAMGMNRYLDADIDALNPRTMQRAISRKALNKQQCLKISLACAVLFVVFSFYLSRLAGLLSVPLLLILALYSTMKRFTVITHWYLGLCLGLAPIAAQVALEGQVSKPVLIMGLAITFWVAGFDLLYSTQDFEFDRKQGLHSLPAHFGVKATLIGSAACFLVMIIMLVAVKHVSLQNLGVWYDAGVVAVAATLGFELWLVSDAWTLGYSKRINAAFFNANAAVSLIFLTFCLLDYFSRA